MPKCHFSAIGPGNWRNRCRVPPYAGFSQGPLQLAQQTVEQHAERLLRLYERQAKIRATPSEVARVLGAYVKRWRRWCRAGLRLARPMPFPPAGTRETR